jgi:hypothetical protein
MWAGSPAKMVIMLSPEEMSNIDSYAQDVAFLAVEHAFQCSKDYTQIAADEEAMQDREERDPDYFQPRDIDPSYVQGLGEPGRIFNSILTRPDEGLKSMQKDEKK